MAVKAKDAIVTARSMIGTPYGSGKGEIDCINLIKHVIRNAPGGVKDYTTAGSNSLWNSYDMSAKYRDLTWRQDSTEGASAGMLAFKRSGSDVHHVGLVTDVGTVIHASSSYGKVAETPLDKTWDLIGIHRYIDAEKKEMDDVSVKWTGKVTTQGGALNLRVGPGVKMNVRATIPNGEFVDVMWDEPIDGWLFIGTDGLTGYVAAQYIERVESPLDGEESAQDAPTTEEMVTVTLPMKTAQALYEALGFAIS